MKLQSPLEITVLILIVLSLIFLVSNQPVVPQPKATKIYWFIPDGMRADPEDFDIYKWAEDGKLPNIKKLMEEGSYGYSIPDFPSHTPTNFASLLTGSHPSTHGVADGPMHVEDFPLATPSVKGFSSTAKKVAPIWTTFENEGKEVVLLSVPGSTPPELRNGITIKGRWGGWGAETYAINYEPLEMQEERKTIGKGTKLFFLGQKLTQFVNSSIAEKWENTPESSSPSKEVTFQAYGLAIHAYIYDSTDDNKTNYDRTAFSFDKSDIIFDSKQGTWSDWFPVKLKFQDSEFDSNVRIKIIKLWDDGRFRVRIFYDNLNRFVTEPSSVADDLERNVGPMVDFADNWPPQLIYEDEDKETFLEEANMSLEWHKEAAEFVIDKYDPDVFIQDIYTPNQMLESRWWLGSIDDTSKHYSPDGADDAWDDIIWMYQGLDNIIGSMMDNADENTLIVLSSDHGVCPLHRVVRLNNLFAEKGWLNFSIDPVTGETQIDWDNTKVIYLKMAHIYVNPDGLGGNWTRGSGSEYEALRTEVIELLKDLEDKDGTRPVVNAIKWEDAPAFFRLPSDRVGDIVIEALPTYFWFEEMDANLTIFSDPLTTGYKQTIDPSTNCMRTPFIIMGPGVKKNHFIESPISHVDQMPTILDLMGINIPEYVEGSVIGEILTGK